MVIYLDFEANGANQVHEIISIGAVAETGEKFYSLVRPHSKLDRKIKELTHISQEEAEIAPSIEDVMSNFFTWLCDATKWDLSDVKFFVYGGSDRDFVRASISFVSDIFTLDRLQYIHDHIERVDKRIAKKFNREMIGLRSAYLTMRLFSNDPVEQFHNALEDAEMLKYVWENIDNYELPEDGTVVKVPRKDMRYGTKVPASAKKADKYQVPIKVWINGKKVGYKEWLFPNVGAASGMFCYAKNVKKRLKVMDEMLTAATKGEVYRNKHIEIMKGA